MEEEGENVVVVEEKLGDNVVVMEEKEGDTYCSFHRGVANREINLKKSEGGECDGSTGGEDNVLVLDNQAEKKPSTVGGSPRQLRRRKDSEVVMNISYVI